ncbi:MAG: hypothetical protein ETSY2_06290 [Candidatus Entotheonella gemina]|uniref:SMP-30/Gluconolactonase/LRE-like region domain-containing protein n=1 Tax=Candidatus Entotheonella gemina TaxID=1429439 RepID=W4MD97_9BACT|nr:MAG: hypothetical protein ETSY2_06290 [Candidatus Entotheonella gemina]
MIGQGPEFFDPQAVVVEPNGDLVVIDPVLEVVRVDPVSGDRTLMAGSHIGDGPLLVEPHKVKVSSDGVLFVLDSAYGAVLRVEPATGDRTLVSGRGLGQGGSLAQVLTLTIEPAGTLIVGRAPGSIRLLRIDPATGDRTVVSALDVGSGLNLRLPDEIVVDEVGDLIALDPSYPAIFRVNRVTGDRTIISGCEQTPLGCPETPIGNGPELRTPRGLVIEASGHFVVLSQVSNAVLRVDPETGDRTVISGCTAPIFGCPENPLGSGPPLDRPVAVALEASGMFLVLDKGLGLIRIDPSTGDRTVLAEMLSDTAPDLLGVRDLAVEPTDAVVVADGIQRSLIRVARDGNTRQVISDISSGDDPPLDRPVDMTRDVNGFYVVLNDRASHAIMIRVDPLTGTRNVISDCADGGLEIGCDVIGEGPRISLPVAIAVESSNDLVVGNRSQIYRVDSVSGDRAILSSGTGRERGNGQGFAIIGDIAIEQTGSIAVTDWHTGALLRVDPATGDRILVSGCPERNCSDDLLVGEGPMFGCPPLAMALDEDGFFIVLQRFPTGLMRVDPINGDRTLMNR